ncbi:MAG: glycosyltransferase family 9 protein [Bacteroidales bacterium]
MSNRPLKLLVFRFSALGDVAMTVPVLWSLTRQNPNIEITFVSKGFTKGIVSQVPGVRFVALNDKGEHKGFAGLFRLFLQLRRMGPWDGVADLHNVLRTKILRLLFFFTSSKIAYIDKGRSEKRRLTRKNGKVQKQLKHTVVRYADVFYNLGLGIEFQIIFNGLFTSKPELTEDVLKKLPHQNNKWIGFAPFAKHVGKEYPFEKSLQLIHSITQEKDVGLILFGAPGEEKNRLDSIAKGYGNVFSIAGEFNFKQELKIMAHLHVMISMDSANMHLAVLANTPVVSIWGATHPYAGFYAWGQPADLAVQSTIECRPCSVFGNKPCFRKDYACLNRIEPQDIAKKVNGLVGRKT